MSRLGVFGGSFNPPHFGHLRLADAAAERYGLDEVRWIPNNLSPFKTGNGTADAFHRLAMTKLTVRDRPRYTVSDVELSRGGISFTVDTLRSIRIELPDAELFLLLGSDAFAEFERWSRPEEIRRMVRIVVYPRGDTKRARELLRAEDDWLDGPEIDVSSEEIRERIAHGSPVADLLPLAVRQYIESEGLYLPD